MAITDSEVTEILSDFRAQKENLWQGNFHNVIEWLEIDFLELMDKFEENLISVLRNDNFVVAPGRLPFLMIFPPKNAGDLKERLIGLGFSEIYGQIQVKLSKIKDLEYTGRHPYMIYDVDPGHLLKDPQFTPMLGAGNPPRRPMKFFEAATMASFIADKEELKVNFQIVITGSEYCDEYTAPAIDFLISRANPVINYFDLRQTSPRIGVPSCSDFGAFKPLTSY